MLLQYFMGEMLFQLFQWSGDVFNFYVAHIKQVLGISIQQRDQEIPGSLSCFPPIPSWMIFRVVVKAVEYRGEDPHIYQV